MFSNWKFIKWPHYRIPIALRFRSLVVEVFSRDSPFCFQCASSDGGLTPCGIFGYERIFKMKLCDVYTQRDESVVLEREGIQGTITTWKVRLGCCSRYLSDSFALIILPLWTERSLPKSLNNVESWRWQSFHPPQRNRANYTKFCNCTPNRNSGEWGSLWSVSHELHFNGVMTNRWNFSATEHITQSS